MRYFYWLRVKNWNHLHVEFSRSYLRDKIYLEKKVSFIHIDSIASLKPFFITWLWKYCTFSDISMVIMKSSPLQKTPSTKLFSKNE